MKTFIAYGLISSVFGSIDYVANCGNNVPECFTYNDGCNECTCDPDTGLSACTERACLVAGTPFCEVGECEGDSYWLSFDTFQPPGYPTCSSRFLKSAIFLEDNSKCACPASNPFYEQGVGCVTEDYCEALRLGTRPNKRDIFRFRAPNQNRRCPYDYQLCTSNSQCGDGLICNIPKSNYETCIPLSAKFDRDCNLVTGCNRCIDDCMGTGYGYCVAEDTQTQCETGGCSSQLCGGPGTSDIITTCDFPCEYGCLQFQTCGEDINGDCGWQTNVGSELLYATCIADCERTNCAAVLCADEATRCAKETCNGCKAQSVQCGVTDCLDDECCGCVSFTLNGRDVTNECGLGEIACKCAQPTEDETHCCLGEEFSSLCQLNCGTCYDIDLDCTKGPCANP